VTTRSRLASPVGWPLGGPLAGAIGRGDSGSGVPAAGRALGIGLLACALTLGALWLGASPASALSTHVFSSSFGTQGSGVGQVSSPQGVAVNQATGDVYVADTGNARVDEFSSSGTFIRAWGWGVLDGASSFETCTTTCQAGVSGSGAGQFTTPAFIAVDNSAGASAGDVYVGDTGDNLVTKFDSNGGLVSSWGTGGQLNGSTATDGPFGSLAGIAVDSSGTLDVFDTNTRMFEFAQDGTFSTDFTTARGTDSHGLGVDSAGNFFKVNGDDTVEKFTASTDFGQVTANSSTTGLTVDPSSGDLYVDHGGSAIDHYAFDGSGNVIGSGCTPAPFSGCPATDSFGSGSLSGAAGLAVDSASGNVYAADTGNQRVDIFIPVILPIVATTAPSNVSQTTATLNGTVNPGGVQLTDCHFDYGTTTAYGQTAPCVPNAGSIPPDSSGHAVSADLTGLTGGTTYHFRLEASNANGGNQSQDQTLNTFVPGETGTFGSPGSGNGQFGSYSPFGFGVDQRSGDVYVSDLFGHRVEVFDAQGNYLSQFGAGGTGGGQFNLATGVAVDNSTGSSGGDVYVADYSNNRVEKFDSAGNFILAFGGGVDETTGADVCTASSGHTCGAGSTGSGPGQFGGGMLGNVLAVDSQGDVYVTDGPNGRLEKFDAQGNYISQFSTSPPTQGLAGAKSSPVSVALNSADEIYVADQMTGNVEKFDASGTLLATIAVGTNPTAVATDAEDDVFVFAGGTHVLMYDSTGAQVGDFGQGALSDGLNEGIAFGDTARVLYGPDVNNSRVLMIGEPAAAPPVVDLEGAASVTSSDAKLRAKVNPNWARTRFHFEYGTSTAYGASAPIADEDLGSGGADKLASATVTGLQPNTTYHYRVVATNALGTTDGPDHSFTTAPLTALFALPDNRAYEQVTPANKGGGEVANGGGQTVIVPDRAAPNGDALFYSVTAPLAGASSSGDNYLAVRGGGGWASHDLIPPQAGDVFGVGSIQATSLDLSKGLLVDGGNSPFGQDDPALVSGEPSGNQNLFVRDNASSTYQLANPTPPGVAPATARLANVSADLAHVAFDEQAALTPDAPGAGVDNLYDWSAGTLRLVSLLPDGMPALSPQFGGGAGAMNDVSADGSRIFWFTRTVGQLYVRESAATTVQYTASHRTTPDPNGPDTPTYWPPSRDGSKAFFTSCEKLNDDSTAVSPAPFSSCEDPSRAGSTTGSDLYQFDTYSNQLSDLTVDHTAGDPLGADVQGMLGSSNDGSYAYFVANGMLASGASRGDCHQTANGVQVGSCNLYVEHDGTTRLIAVLDNRADQKDWMVDEGGPVSVTPDGRHLVFESARSLTGYDNTDANTGQADSEVFLYDAPSGQLTCVSCNPSGQEPTGPATINQPNSDSLFGSGSTPAYQDRNLSDDGSRVFFDSSDALSAHDTNGQQDVYEYEQDGSGSCERAAGCVYLISRGTSGQDSRFIDASASGNDVFFATTDQLVPQDIDQAFDVYDARVGGGFPAPTPPAPPCSGDACKGPQSGAPLLPTAASISFSGPGNASPGGTAGKIRVLSRIVHGSTFLITVSVPGKGWITITGVGIKAVRKSVAHAGTYRLKITLTRAARSVLRSKHKLKLRLRIAYAPAGGSLSSISFSLTVKPAPHPHRRHAGRAANDRRGGAR
jgi:DNA-binding beta-propeller fold protein YncE